MDRQARSQYHTDVKPLRDGANSRSRFISMTSIGKPTGAATSKRGAWLGANGALALLRSTSATICDRGCDLERRPPGTACRRARIPLAILIPFGCFRLCRTDCLEPMFLQAGQPPRDLQSDTVVDDHIQLDGTAIRRTAIRRSTSAIWIHGLALIREHADYEHQISLSLLPLFDPC